MRIKEDHENIYFYIFLNRLIIAKVLNILIYGNVNGTRFFETLFLPYSMLNQKLFHKGFLYIFIIYESYISVALQRNFFSSLMSLHIFEMRKDYSNSEEMKNNTPIPPETCF